MGDGRAEADSLIGAVVAATRVVSELVLTDVWLSEFECEANSSIGVPFFVFSAGVAAFLSRFSISASNGSVVRFMPKDTRLVPERTC